MTSPLRWLFLSPFDQLHGAGGAVDPNEVAVAQHAGSGAGVDDTGQPKFTRNHHGVAEHAANVDDQRRRHEHD